MALLALAVLGNTPAIAQTIDDSRFIAFPEFIAATRVARFEDYARLSEARVRDAAAFEEMRRHVLTMYDGVDQLRSFVTDGTYADCITVLSQPSVRLLGIREIAIPPSPNLPEVPETDVGEENYAKSIVQLGERDRFGNPISCPEAYIPMQRITLERLVRYPTLRDFFAKGSKANSWDKPEWKYHPHAAGYTKVNNLGGDSILNVWKPTDDYGGFSLSQQWYISADKQQTVEGGWEVYPAYFGGSKDPHLFIFWTADNYVDTGCSNLDCPGFVQTDFGSYIGGMITPTSSTNGTQYALRMQWKLWKGNWFLFIKFDASGYKLVGYYPGSIYNGGPITKYAAYFEFGGEVTSKDGLYWPEMGSGAFAEKGWKHAAYQRKISYIPTWKVGGLEPVSSIHEVQVPKCYTVSTSPPAGFGGWGTYIYFGGPGGSAICGLAP